MVTKKQTSLEDELAPQPTATPGVFLNRMGVLVNANGVALQLADVIKQDKDHLSALANEKVDTPAAVLKAYALDPTKPVQIRLEAAKAAAPYYNRKKPVAIDGGEDEDGNPIPLFDPKALKGLSDEELVQLKALLEKGVTPAAIEQA